MEHENINRHAQPSQRPLSYTKPAIDIHISASSLHCQQESLRPRTYYTGTQRTCDLALTKAQGTVSPTKPLPAGFSYIASKRTCDPALAKTLRQQEAAEDRVLQIGKKNKIPTVQQKKVEQPYYHAAM